MSHETVVSPQSAPRVAILGASPFTANRGVSALGSSIIKLVCDAYPDAKISVLMGHRTSEPSRIRVAESVKTVETVNYRLSPRAPLEQQLWWIVLSSLLYRLAPTAGMRRRLAAGNRWIRTIAEADFVGDIRGGDSFSDIYGLTGFVVDCLTVLSVIWIRGGIHLLPQTHGPFRSRVARSLARHILMRAESIWSRDRASLNEIAQLTEGKRAGSLCPDVAFALEAVRPATPEIAPPYTARPRSRLIGVNVNGLMYNGGYTRDNMFGLALDYRVFLKDMVERFLSDENNHVLFVPHTFAAPGSAESDPEACREVMASLNARLRDRAHLVTQEYDQHQIKGVIGMCEFFVGSRMHACIAALSQGIPTVGVAYSKKFSGVFETIGAAEWVIDGRTAGTDDAVERVDDLFRNRDRINAVLQERVALAKKTLCNSFENLLNGGLSKRAVPLAKGAVQVSLNG